jgi:metallo-beta-lactamase family protein
MAQTITFEGAAQTVTGSRHLIRIDDKLVLVDCGLFQGGRELRQRNWEPFPVNPSEIDAVVITHAHNDHIGYLPRLVAKGYRGPIYMTPATAALCRISLPDSARIQEEDARTANRHGTRHDPALPLYTEEDAFAAMKQFENVPYDTLRPLPGGAQFRFIPAGHILGSAMAEIFFENGEKIVMTGDLGRYDTPIIKDPATVEFTEYLVIESTYGDRLHSKEDPSEKLASILNDAWRNQSVVLVPSFSIGRTQELLFYMRRLQNAGRMPRMPIYVDSPMATLVTNVYQKATSEHDEDMRLSVEQGLSELEPDGLVFTRDRRQSQELNSRPGPFVVIAGSGMANGGRIVHHLLHHLDDPNAIILFTGYQAEGTLGRRLLEGHPEVRILRQEVQVKARIERMNALSAHADQGEIMHWLKNFKSPPRTTFLVHGELPSQEALKAKIEEELGWHVEIPSVGQSFDL